MEDYIAWVEGLTIPQWVECGWAEFNPQWIDGPECVPPTIQWIECGWVDQNPQWADGPLCPYPQPTGAPKKGKLKKSLRNDDDEVMLLASAFMVLHNR